MHTQTKKDSYRDTITGALRGIYPDVKIREPGHGKTYWCGLCSNFTRIENHIKADLVVEVEIPGEKAGYEFGICNPCYKACCS